MDRWIDRDSQCPNIALKLNSAGCLMSLTDWTIETSILRSLLRLRLAVFKAQMPRKNVQYAVSLTAAAEENSGCMLHKTSLRSFIHCRVTLYFTHRPCCRCRMMKKKKKKVFCPPAAKVFFFRLSWHHGFAIINLARRRYFCRYPRHKKKKKKKLKEDIAMLFGNDSWMTGKEMDSPSGWQFAARGAWMCACSKSGCCQEWLSPEFEPNSSRRREDSAPLFCADTTLTALCLSASDAATAFKTCRKNKTKQKKKVFERSLLWKEKLPPSLCSASIF